MIAWLAALSGAQGADGAIDALHTEIERGMAGLSLPDAPPLYYLRYRLYDLTTVSAEASLGALVHTDRQPSATLGVEVRVGNADFDNTNFGGWQNGLARTSLPDTFSPSALRTTAWRLTDGAYKQAVEQYARKQAQFSPPPDYPGDFVVSEPVVADTGVGELTEDGDALVALATELSAALGGDPLLLRGEVFLGHEAGRALVVDSDGTEVVSPIAETTLRAVAATRATDGGLVSDQWLLTVRDPGALPPIDQLKREVRDLGQRIRATAAAAPLKSEYVGPVIFEDQAAQALFRYLLIPQIEGTPPNIPFDSFFGDLGSEASKARMGRRVLPPGFTAVADPTAHPTHPGSFTHDAEGTPAQAVTVVDDGIVRDVLRSRVPTKDRPTSNGQARGTLGRRLEGRVSGLTVNAPRARSRSALRRRAIKLARAYGHDHFVVVRRIQVPGVMRLAGGGWFDEDAASALPPPVAVYRVYADGREERLRSANFAAVQRWALRDIAAAGPSSSGSFMAPFSGSVSSLGPTEGLASWLSVPDVLVNEVELVPTSSDPRDVPLLPPPAPD